MLRSLTVKDYMSENVVTFTPNTNVLDAARLLVERRISGAPVLDKHGNVVGVLSEKDCLQILLRAAYFEEAGGKVSEYMTRGVKTVNMDDSIVDVAKLFVDEGVKRYPVMRDNVLVGQISRGDVLRALETIW